MDIEISVLEPMSLTVWATIPKQKSISIYLKDTHEDIVLAGDLWYLIGYETFPYPKTVWVIGDDIDFVLSYFCTQNINSRTVEILMPRYLAKYYWLKFRHSKTTLSKVYFWFKALTWKSKNE